MLTLFSELVSKDYKTIEPLKKKSPSIFRWRIVPKDLTRVFFANSKWQSIFTWHTNVIQYPIKTENDFQRRVGLLREGMPIENLHKVPLAFIKLKPKITSEVTVSSYCA